jgi:hypothetical protein
MEACPSRMFAILRECGALARLLPELDRLFGVPQRADYHPEVDTGVHVMMVVDQSAQRGCALPVRFAALLHDLGKGTTPATDLPRHPGHEARSVDLVGAVCARFKVPVDCRDLALLVARYHGDIHRGPELAPATIVRLLESTDACADLPASNNSSRLVPATFMVVAAGRTCPIVHRRFSVRPWRCCAGSTPQRLRAPATTEPALPRGCTRRVSRRCGPGCRQRSGEAFGLTGPALTKEDARRARFIRSRCGRRSRIPAGVR